MATEAICPADTRESHRHQLKLGAASVKLIGQGSGNLRTAVLLPEGEDLQEWIAVHGKPFPV